MYSNSTLAELGHALLAHYKLFIRTGYLVKLSCVVGFGEVRLKGIFTIQSRIIADSNCGSLLMVDNDLYQIPLLVN